MKRNTTFGTTLAFISCCWCLLFTANAWAQDESAIYMEKRGRMALEARQLPQALELFSEGSAEAADPELKARLDFRKAVTLQQMANTATPEDAAEKLLQAARLYHAYLKQNPKSTATANNLAKIYETLGNMALQDSDAKRAQGVLPQGGR